MKPRSPKKTKSSNQPKTKVKEESLLPFQPLPLLFPIPPLSNRKRKSLFLFLNILILLQCSSIQQKDKEVYHNHFENTEKEVHSKLEELQKSGIKSLSYMYLLGDGKIHVGNLGETDKNKIQRFKIGSITKLFTGISLLQLQDQGKLKLDDPVSKYLPEIAEMQTRETNLSEISIRDILTHQSGLPSDFASGFFLSPEVTDKEILDSFHSLSKQLSRTERNPPRKVHSYSNFGFGLLGIVIERASGFGIDEYFQKEIFAKAGMKHSTLLELKEGSELVSGYSGLFWKTKTKRQIIRDLTAGSLSTTGEDMGLFMKALFQSKKGEGLLSKSSFVEFHHIQKGPSSNFQMKMGLPLILQEKVVEGKSIWIAGHSGSLPPYFADLVYDPETETASFIAGNTAGFATANIQPTNQTIMDIIYEYKTGGSLESPPLVERKEQNQLDGYYGMYASPYGVHEVKNGKPPQVDIMGINFDLVEKENRFGTNLYLFFGLIPIKDKTIDSFRLEFEPWEENKVFTLYSSSLTKGSIGFAFRFEPDHKLPDSSYFTTYQTKDPVSIIPRLELKKDKRGFLLVTIHYSLGGLGYSSTLPCQMESATNLRILGYGRNLAEKIELKKVDGKPRLLYSGIEFSTEPI
ncbi:serine hydrolase domain-containing protein [Leptospira brenneri]|uniref:Class A beta-lactamase-related serine hydrolase n=1 Tax=Leptospira brenneri TaxID=2023182 RepID=A0A2M9Y543_9LEPT|nr:serine hydrolase domain-containing protein [Leptospira brenneri]PJZ46619.1 penicillin-binding protein [Leptospira brenneri]TGK96729.1 class A beta-lactamase-related serine hydrolase [Leptospira brenneri]